jgi:hypothetical protein
MNTIKYIKHFRGGIFIMSAIAFCGNTIIMLPNVRNGGVSDFRQEEYSNNTRVQPISESKYFRAETLGGQIFELQKEFAPGKLVRNIKEDGNYIKITFDSDERKWEKQIKDIVLKVPHYYISYTPKHFSDDNRIFFRQEYPPLYGITQLEVGTTVKIPSKTTIIGFKIPAKIIDLHSIRYMKNGIAVLNITLTTIKESKNSRIIIRNMRIDREQFASLSKIVNYYNSIKIDGKKYQIGDILNRDAIHNIYVYRGFVHIEFITQDDFIYSRTYRIN